MSINVATQQKLFSMPLPALRASLSSAKAGDAAAAAQITKHTGLSAAELQAVLLDAEVARMFDLGASVQAQKQTAAGPATSLSHGGVASSTIMNTLALRGGAPVTPAAATSAAGLKGRLAPLDARIQTATDRLEHARTTSTESLAQLQALGLPVKTSLLGGLFGSSDAGAPLRRAMNDANKSIEVCERDLADLNGKRDALLAGALKSDPAFAAEKPAFEALERRIENGKQALAALDRAEENVFETLAAVAPSRIVGDRTFSGVTAEQASWRAQEGTGVQDKFTFTDGALAKAESVLAKQGITVDFASANRDLGHWWSSSSRKDELKERTGNQLELIRNKVIQVRNEVATELGSVHAQRRTMLEDVAARAA